MESENLKMKKFIAKKTHSLRYRIVKLITPKLYAEISYAHKVISKIPRPMTMIMREKATSELVGAEIGVAKGDNALNLLIELPMKKLYLIDPYIPYKEDGKLFSHHNCKDIAKKRLNGFSQVVWIEKKSEEAIFEITEPLDFVYIDGNHNYDFVKRDIELYYKIVRPNGIIGGHDICMESVAKAVNEFCLKNNLVFHSLFPDWWIIKNEK